MSHRSKPVPLTELRAQLSPIVRDIDRVGAVAVTVRGEVRAYLVSPARLGGVADSAAPPPRTIKGTMTLHGDLERGSRDAEAAWRAMAGARR